MLIFTVTSEDTGTQRFLSDGPIEIGRGPQRGDVERHVVSTNTFLSRDHIRIEQLPDEKILVTCLGRNGLRIDQYPYSLSLGESRELRLPVTLRVGWTSIQIETEMSRASASAASIPRESMSRESMSSDSPANEVDDDPAELSTPFWYQTDRRPSANFDAKCDLVDATVFAPPAAAQGSALLVQVFAHTPEQKHEAKQLAQEFDSEAEPRGFKSLELEIPRGSLLTIHLTMPGLVVENPIQFLLWHGQPSAVQFSVSIPDQQKLGTTIGTVTVTLEGVPLGYIKFKLTILAQDHRPTNPEPRGQIANAYKMAFISYASHDRDEVLKRVQMLSRLKIQYFQDLLDLEPGDRWERELYRHIDDCDLFLLFWSIRRESHWVMQEVRYALERKQGSDLHPPEIIPVIIEGPPAAEPPAELSHLHFNDYLLYFILPEKNSMMSQLISTLTRLASFGRSRPPAGGVSQ